MLDARLLDLIQANPGITYARLYGSITADKSIRPGYFRHHLRQLIRSGKIIKIQDGSFWREGVEPKAIMPSGFIREPSRDRLMAGR